MILYHFTSRSAAAQILVAGVRDDEDGGVWLSPDPMTTMGEVCRSVLIEVTFNQTGELSAYASRVDEEELDEDSGEFVPSDLSYQWYHVPAAIVNQATRRILSDNERLQRIVEGFD